ncbi:MAG: glycosyltransferase family 39 protein [Candidatus Omnitrophota bacterium]
MKRFLYSFQKNIFAKLNRFELICFLLIVIGIILRLKHYFMNCSLWTDEAWVAVSITSRSFMDILQDIDIFPNASKPPLGFLVLAKLSTFIFGNNEYALRSFSLACGVSSLFLFHHLVKRLKDNMLTILTLGFFCLSPTLIYFSAELKQYSLDLFIGLILYLILIPLAQTELHLKKAALIGLLGCLAMWVSNAALFILAGFGAMITIVALERNQLKTLCYSLVIYVSWGASFWFLYQRSLSGMMTNENLLQTWPGAFLESPIFSKEAWVWVGEIFLAMFTDPLGISFAGVAFVLFMFGLIILLRDKREYALLFFFSIFVTLLAAIFHKYPFRGRLLLFLFPAVLIFIIEGMLWVSRKAPKRFFAALLVALSVLLLFNPFLRTVQGFTKDYCRQENREAMSFLKENYRKGDFLLLNSAAQFSLWYYGSRFGIPKLFEETWAGMERGILKKGVKVARFWEGMKTVKGKKCLLFRYEYILYDNDGQYRKTLARAEMSNADLYILAEGVPFSYPVEGRRLWLVLGDPSSDFERIATWSLGLRFPQVFQFKRKGISIYLYQAK